MTLTNRPESLSIGIKLVPGIPEELLPENYKYKYREMEKSVSLFYTFDKRHSDIPDIDYLLTDREYKFYGCKFVLLNYSDMAQFNLVIDVSRKLKCELDRTRARQIATEVMLSIKGNADSLRNYDTHIFVKKNNKMYMVTFHQDISDEMLLLMNGIDY